MKLARRLHRLFVLVAILGCGGCGDGGRLEVNPVRGQVTYRGQGVPNATVVLHPLGRAAEQLQKMRPYAYADDQGRFEIKTYVTGDGAPPGEYEVAIIAAASGDRDDPQAASRGIGLPMPVVQKYANQKTSGIKIRVEPGPNELDPFVLN
jgi:hypothetical protein